MRWSRSYSVRALVLFCPLLFLSFAACARPGAAAQADPFKCGADLVKPTLAALAGAGHRTSSSALAATFGHLDRQARVEVRLTECGFSFESLRYQRPNRMQFVAWLNMGSSEHPHALRDPRETQISDRLGYIGGTYRTPWPGVGVTAHRMLLPDAWHDSKKDSAPTFYLLMPPQEAIQDLSIRVLNTGNQQVFVERWRGLLHRCSPGAQCPAPNLDPRYFSRFTTVLRVQRAGELPISLTTVAQAPDRAHGRLIWTRAQLVSQAAFRYGGTFSIHFVKD